MMKITGTVFVATASLVVLEGCGGKDDTANKLTTMYETQEKDMKKALDKEVDTAKTNFCEPVKTKTIEELHKIWKEAHSNWKEGEDIKEPKDDKLEKARKAYIDRQIECYAKHAKGKEAEAKDLKKAAKKPAN